MNVDGNGSGSGGSGSGSGDVDAPPAAFEELISRTGFTVGPNEDGYRCVRVQIPDDTWIDAFEPMPGTLGVDHEILTITSGTPSETGPYACDEATAIGPDDKQMIYAYGIGTDKVVLPVPYAVHLPAGSYINLAVHVYNPGTTAITSGLAGVMARKITVGSTLPKAVDFMFNGTKTISVPFGQQTTLSGSCTIPEDWTVLNVWPHMHATGTASTFEVDHGASVDKVIDNKPYTYGTEIFYAMGETPAASGDKLVTRCTWNNTDGTKNPSHTTYTYPDEMCFTGFYKYPANANYGLYYCVH